MTGTQMMNTSYWEILVPTVHPDGRPIHTRFHRVWDKKVLEILTNKGLSIFPPIKGQWVSPSGRLFKERMIPVGIACSRDDIEEIVRMTAEYYDQEAVMARKISDDVILYFRDKEPE